MVPTMFLIFPKPISISESQIFGCLHLDISSAHPLNLDLSKSCCLVKSYAFHPIFKFSIVQYITFEKIYVDGDFAC